MKFILYLICLYVCAMIINLSHAASTFQLQSTKNYVVQIVCASGSGTGTIISKNKIITAAHVVVEKDCLVLDYKNRDYAIINYNINEENDLAVITLDKSTKSAGIRMGDKPLQEYSKIYTIGFPLNLTYYLSEGIYQHTYTKDFDILNMNIIYGNSGGGLFSIENGEIKLYGVISAIRQMALTKTIAIPIYYMSISTNYNNTKHIYKSK